MNTSLRPITCTWMLCGLIATGAGPGCNGGEKPPQPGIAPASTWIPDSPNDMANSATQDMAIPGPDCQAAAGLVANKRLICIDFTTALPDAMSGWTFDKDCGDARSNWIIAQEALMLSNFDSFKSGATETACSFRSPRLNATDLAGFKMLTLAILQSVDVRSETTNQRAQILLDGQTVPLVQFTGGISNSSVPPFRRNLITIEPNDFSTGLQAMFSVVTTGLAGAGYAGWQIKSIAVLGHK